MEPEQGKWVKTPAPLPAACSNFKYANQTIMPQKTIQKALEEAQEWMNLEGVAGLAAGKKDGKDCIMVYTTQPVPALPRRLHGYAVVVQTGGPVEALPGSLPS